LTVPAVCQEEETMNVIPKEKQESIKSEIEAGTGIRKIAGKVGVSRNTVRKYIRKQEEKNMSNIQSKQTPGVLQNTSIEQIAADFNTRMKALLADFRREAEKWQKAVEALEAVLKDVA
jgi:transposase